MDKNFEEFLDGVKSQTKDKLTKKEHDKKLNLICRMVGNMYDGTSLLEEEVSYALLVYAEVENQLKEEEKKELLSE